LASCTSRTLLLHATYVGVFSKLFCCIRDRYCIETALWNPIRNCDKGCTLKPHGKNHPHVKW
jgi:hypothetical protein